MKRCLFDNNKECKITTKGFWRETLRNPVTPPSSGSLNLKLCHFVYCMFYASNTNNNPELICKSPEKKMCGEYVSYCISAIFHLNLSHENLLSLKFKGTLIRIRTLQDLLVCRRGSILFLMNEKTKQEACYAAEKDIDQYHDQFNDRIAMEYLSSYEQKDLDEELLKDRNKTDEISSYFHSFLNGRVPYTKIVAHVLFYLGLMPKSPFRNDYGEQVYFVGGMNHAGGINGMLSVNQYLTFRNGLVKTAFGSDLYYLFACDPEFMSEM